MAGGLEDWVGCMGADELEVDVELELKVDELLNELDADELEFEVLELLELLEIALDKLLDVEL